MAHLAPARCVAAAVVLTAIAGCSVNPATGKRQLSLISESQEIAMGRQAHEEVLRTMKVSGDAEMQQYVDRVGRRLAAVSERPDLNWTFTLIDDPTVNAFALPGGYIYLTRGILTYMTSEAQAAAVLGHEIGHVTGRHSVEQMSKAQLASVGLMLGSILSPTVAQLGGLAQTGTQLLFLKFGRDHERQADDLGLRYVVRAGYDPAETIEMFRVLEAQSATEAGGRLPEWLSTHPNPGSRVARMREEIAQQFGADAPGEVGGERFLEALDGTVFGENPREGYFAGSTFYHPDMRFQLQMPPQWRTANLQQAVIAVSPEQDAAVILGLAPEPSAQRAAQQFFSQPGVHSGPVEAKRLNGLPAVSGRFQAQTQNGTIAGMVSFIEQDGRVYQLMAYSDARRFDARRAALEQAVSSFAPLRDPRVIDVQPQRIDLVRVPSDMTLPEFQKRFPSTVPLETVRVINHLDEGELLHGRHLYKRVTGGVASAQ